jgi:hypothetical protein
MDSPSFTLTPEDRKVYSSIDFDVTPPSTPLEHKPPKRFCSSGVEDDEFPVDEHIVDEFCECDDMDFAKLLDAAASQAEEAFASSQKVPFIHIYMDRTF